MEEKKRCSWVNDTSLMIKYHDIEWGVAVYDDAVLFEFLILEGAQAGLSWETVLKKRENYREAFDGFDVEKISKYDEAKVVELLGNAGIIRNRLKVKSAITNARAFLEVQEEFGTFSKYLWGFVDGTVVRNKIESDEDYVVTSEVSGALSKDLKKRGFKFVGSTICYAYMQAVGMVDDHWVGCWKH
ncbi:DNA-3-methyladenine glycosylase I [archaeon]|nr:DNA-3-methyladenine glycosylase I [archaeon]MBT6182599.1 DNA-3-methyladenine glycosylase I [archaeon]MBT6606277.1 DNA-3-methyladenine glycosylase I [archaeon]MBT7251554.1 DNA-3-methyladenine glycosylase I [archaeon]MBT7661194.1 DNA-3-methyladenine glycosylase I [archaeon]